VFRTRYIVIVCLGGALSYTYRVALGDHIAGAPGWLSFVVVWLPSAILLGLVVAYIGPAIAWRIRGAKVVASARDERFPFGAMGRFLYLWALPLALAGAGGVLLARDSVWGLAPVALALLVRPLRGAIAGGRERR
jgi:hypothetical protein